MMSPNGTIFLRQPDFFILLKFNVPNRDGVIDCNALQFSK